VVFKPVRVVTQIKVAIMS